MRFIYFLSIIFIFINIDGNTLNLKNIDNTLKTYNYKEAVYNKKEFLDRVNTPVTPVYIDDSYGGMVQPLPVITPKYDVINLSK